MNSKGVSQVVSVVLLMSIAISSAVSAGVFLTDALGGLQNDVEAWFTGNERREDSSIDIVEGFNSSDGFLMVTVKNTGGTSLTVEENNEKLFDLYVDNTPRDWKYQSGSGRSSRSSVTFGQGSAITMNTTVQFPQPLRRREVRVTGPLEVSTVFFCLSESGGCER